MQISRSFLDEAKNKLERIGAHDFVELLAREGSGYDEKRLSRVIGIAYMKEIAKLCEYEEPFCSIYIKRCASIYEGFVSGENSTNDVIEC